MTKRNIKKIKRLTLWVMFSGLILSGMTSSWANVAFIDNTQGAYTRMMSATDFMIKPQANPVAKHTHAPEPTTLALFGGGFLGMIMSFVREAYLRLKRFFDIIGALVGIVVTAPLMLLTALLVKLSSEGPVIYSQTRVGKDGRLFKIYKFRTMRADAEQQSGPVWAKKNDNRITPVGGFLRKTRLDELPQFFNVLKGDMSLIGPRPERPVFVDQFKRQIGDYEKRLQVKPGITGLAQVWHRYDESLADVRKKIKYDLLYIRKVCFWTDLRILLRTVRVVLTGSGAR